VDSQNRHFAILHAYLQQRSLDTHHMPCDHRVVRSILRYLHLHERELLHAPCWQRLELGSLRQMCRPSYHQVQRQKVFCGQVLKINRFSVASGAFNVLTDCITFVLPLLSIVALQINQKEKIGLIFIFCIAIW
jgi:hypothetical protein